MSSSNRRRGVSLLELLVVVVLMGIFAAAATARFGRTLFAEFGAQGEARKLSLALLTAQRAAITTGDNHYVEFDGLQATRYRLMRRTSGAPAEVLGWEPITADVSVNVSAAHMEFNFEGQALAPYTVDLTGLDRAFRMTVVPITGAIEITES